MYFHLSFVITVAFLSILNTIDTLASRDIVFLIISQTNKFNSRLAENLEQNLIKQGLETKQVNPVVYLSHRDFPHDGGWTVLPLLPRLAAAHAYDKPGPGACEWLIVCTDRTRIDLKKLMKTLAKHDHTKETWIGFALHDREATIIHHFAFFENPESFSYPHMASGFAISMPLLRTISVRLADSDKSEIDLDFSIDASHELALYIQKSADLALKHDDTFCLTQGRNCATYIAPFVSCGDPVPHNSLYFAVKTCSKFHNNRVQIAKDSWSKFASLVRYFSDKEDATIPTVTLGVPNTEHGHCGKTVAILKYVSNEIRHKPEVKWVVLVDDDTIISPARLRQLLSCYLDEQLLALGERYGYRVRGGGGYNYITGGGGTVLGAELVHELAAEGACDCPTLDTPDDMYLGICLARKQVPIVHSHAFHQARPADYAPEILLRNETISFHKHWMIDPAAVYRKWFQDFDEKLWSTREKDEL